MHKSLQHLQDRYPSLSECMDQIVEAYSALHQGFTNNSKLLVCGNGGSASDANHIVSELMKDFEIKRKIDNEIAQQLHYLHPKDGAEIAEKLQRVLPTISLTSNTALISAIANDIGAEMIFAQQVFGYGRKGDVLLCLSTSGNSKNILYATYVAKSMGIKTIGLTGRSGGKLADIADIAICVPADRTLEIQELHLPIYHSLCIALEETLFSQQ